MRQQFTEDYLSQYYWHEHGSATPWLGAGTTYDGLLTTAQAIVAVDARDDASVEAIAAANKALIKPPNGTVALELRFRSDGTSAGDQEILELYAAAGVDHYVHVDQLTIDRGTQEYSSTIFFYDTIVSAGEQWITATSELSTTSNHIGRYVINTHGYDRFLLTMTTKDANTTNLYVDWRRH
jgi:hypothetical protein